MHCPFCNHAETQVVETRESDEGGVIRRRRRCTKCDKRFTTYERIEIGLPAVVKKDGTRADFDRLVEEYGVAHSCAPMLYTRTHGLRPDSGGSALPAPPRPG